jgi:hypothetical protein
MSGASIARWNDKLGKTQTQEETFRFTITAAKTVSQNPQGQPVLTSFDAIANQAAIDGFLGTTNEFLLAAFDATAMGNDAFACIVNMAGQVDKLVGVKAICYSGTAGTTIVEQYVDASSALTASTLSTECAKGANGNMAVRVAFGNTPDFDALTAGSIELTFYWISK